MFLLPWPNTTTSPVAYVSRSTSALLQNQLTFRGAGTCNTLDLCFDDIGGNDVASDLRGFNLRTAKQGTSLSREADGTL